jgi:tetratricopeptide (TPR) repeat protein
MKRLLKAPVRAVFVACFLALVLCGSVPYFLHRWSHSEPAEPFFSGLGPYTRKVTTSSDMAQRYFDQGLAFLYGYNYDESIRSFEAAAASDSNCPMAYWGIAMANGGGVNDDQTNSARAVAAWKAAGRALQLTDKASAVEKSLIKAVNKRYAMPPPLDRRPLDESYAEAMRRVWKAFPDDADVGALTAKAVLRTRRSDVCQAPSRPLPALDEALHILDSVLAKSPNHPFALHVLIHAVEGSDHPERGEAAANRLRNFAPGLGHLTHMPSHIDIRCGRWQEAVIASEKAIAADKIYQQIVADPGYYRSFMIHDNHMLAYAASMQGQSGKAMQTIQEMLSSIPEDYIAHDVSGVDFFFGMPYELDLRFGRWDAMLAEPAPREYFPVSTALWHFGRGVAYAAQHQLAEAKFEQALFSSARQSVPAGSRFLENDAAQMFEIAAGVLDGEILYREGKVDEAIVKLREAVRGEDRLRYVEPPEWVQPVRHVLGATLMDAGRYAEAETVYREDLVRHPENGWSLFGLSQSLRKQKKNAEAAAVTARFNTIWQHADMKLTASCLCLPGKQ